jgi:hypothetical protein
MLSNSVIAGALASGYLTVLVLQLNPSYPLAPAALLPLALTMGAAYGVNLAVVFYALIVLRQLLAAEVLSPGWLSVRLLSWLSTLAAAGGSAAIWLNLGTFGPMLDADTARRMMLGAVAVSACGAVFLVMALAHVGRRGGGLSGAILAITVALSLILPLVARGPARMPADVPPPVPVWIADAGDQASRVLMVGVDGASLDFITVATAQGRLPNFGRILDGGAAMHLATLSPTQAEPVWTTIATGRLPMASGVRSSATYPVRAGGPAIELLPDYCFASALVRFGFLLEEAHTPASLRARPVWEILSGLGVTVTAIGWPLTYPAPPVNGVMVSDELHRLADDRRAVDGVRAVSPPAALDLVAEAATRPLEADPIAVVASLGSPPAGDVDARSDPAPAVADRLHLQILDLVELRQPARFVAARLPGLDAIAHYYLRYATPQPFGDVTDHERQQYGRVLEDYYGVIDALLGRLMATLGNEDLLLVVSPFGMEPLSPGKRVLERFFGNPRVSGSHERAPDGFLLVYGAAAAGGRRLPRASVLDVTPTILYYLGLPIGRDMDGFARTDAFTDTFTARVPLTFIPSYGGSSPGGSQ